MSILKREIKLEGTKSGAKRSAIFDSRSTYSCISRELAATLESVLPLPQIWEINTAKKGEKLYAKERVILNFYIDGCRFSDEFIAIEDLSEDVIIGAATMQKWRIRLDLENDRVIFDPNVTKLILI